MAAQQVDAEYLKEIEKARRNLRALISGEYCAPLMLRLAWNDAATYDSEKKTGGPNGSIRNEPELKHRANKGLETAVDLCQKVKDQHPKITYADLYQLAGVVAVEIIGGPTIDFIPGRKDSLISPEEGRLPDANQDASHLRDIYTRMGLTDKDIVALSGVRTSLVAATMAPPPSEPSMPVAAAMAPPSSELFRPVAAEMAPRPNELSKPVKAHEEQTEGQSRRDHLKFSNSYFKELLKKQQNDLLKVPSNKALVEDPQFRKYVDLYAKDEDAFFADYAASHKKLSELGFNPPSLEPKPPAARNRAILTQGAIGLAVATTVVILGFLFDASRRSK